MDYYQQGRSQVNAQQANQHYVSYSQSSPASNSAHMYYPGQMQTQQPSYQQHYSAVPPGTANSGLDYTSHSAMSSHSQSGNGRAPRTNNRTGGNMTGDSSQHQMQHQQQQQQQQRYSTPPQEFPLRIIVDSKYVGAIIGTSGSNIREITKETKARVVVDVQRVAKDGQGHSEKAITIIGSLENASRACMKIMEVVQREQEKEESRDFSNHEVELKIRAHNQLVGRLIGRGGATIKKIMQETGTTIYVSNSNEAGHRMSGDMSALSMLQHSFPDLLVQIERTITVKGPSLDAVSAAEQKISAKLRQSFETDMNTRLQMATAVPGTMPFLNAADPYAFIFPRMNAQNANSGAPKVVKLYVPNNMVGAIIGSKGSNIRNIIRNSGANIRIDGGERKEKSDEESREETTHHDDGAHGDGLRLEEKKEDERLVTITGNDLQVCRAQFFIYSRIADQMQVYPDEVKLRSEVIVPSRLVGRIIGKGGQNVRELQRITGASVKIPEDEPKVVDTSSSEENREGPSNEGTVVRIMGNISATQQVQARIGQLISEYSRISLQDRRRDDQDSFSHKQQGSPSSNDAE